MATPWVFTLSPETINEIQVTGTSSTVILQRTVISGSDTGFYTEAFDTNESVTISAVGYADLNVIVDIATTGLVMNPLPKPDYLYAYTDSSATQTTYYCFCDFNYAPSDGYPLYVDTLTNPTVLYKKGQHAGSPTPTFLPATENIISFDGTTLVWDDMDHIDSGSSTRYPQEDVTLGNPTTIYTDTTNLSVGQMLYTNEGADSGFVIDTLNQDGSFMITEESESE